VASEILATGLRHLWQTWKWKTAQKGPGELELDLPIQPVADMQRVAELGQANGPFGGYWRIGTTQVHAAGGEITELLVITGQAGISGYNLVEGEDWAWVIDCYGASTIANFTGAAISIAAPSDRVYGPTDGTPPDIDRLLANWDSTLSIALEPDFSLISPGEPAVSASLPALVMQPSVGLRFSSELGAAGECFLECIIWVGKVGTMPPGMS